MKLLRLFSITFIIVYTFINGDKPIFLNLSDATFLLSLIYISIFAIGYVSNIGLFKTFAYLRYQREFVADNSQDNYHDNVRSETIAEGVGTGMDLIGEKPLEFHEFTEKKYGRKKSNKALLIYAIAHYILSVIFSYLI